MDCAHAYADKQGIPDGNHVYANVYKEAVGAKGGNNVASLTLRTLHKTDILLKGRKGGKLSLFDNCVGQNKNNCVIHLSPLLVEEGFFAEVEICFLIVRHTKNTYDQKF